MNRGAYYDTNPSGSELPSKASPRGASGDVDSPPRTRNYRLLPLKQFNVLKSDIFFFCSWRL